jgi:HlyD family secretion protein
MRPEFTTGRRQAQTNVHERVTIVSRVSMRRRACSPSQNEVMTIALRHRRLATGLVLVAILVAWTFRERHPTDVPMLLPTNVPHPRTIVATGTLQAVTTVQVGTEVSGTVESLRADFNSIVHAGEVIATLDPSLFQAAVGEAQAALLRAQAAEEQAEADETGLEVAAGNAHTKLTRAEWLAASQLIPLADLDAARTAAGTATVDLEGGESRIGETKAAVLQARAAVGEADINLEHTYIRSPIDGVVIARNVDVGQTVAAAVQAPVLFTIAADLKRLQLAVNVDESDVAGIQPGARATFEVESYPGVTFDGTVSMVRLQPTSDATVTYTMIVNVSNADERLRPGMTAIVSLGYQGQAGATSAAATP